MRSNRRSEKRRTRTGISTTFPYDSIHSFVLFSEKPHSWVYLLGYADEILMSVRNDIDLDGNFYEGTVPDWRVL